MEKLRSVLKKSRKKRSEKVKSKRNEAGVELRSFVNHPDKDDDELGVSYLGIHGATVTNYYQNKACQLYKIFQYEYVNVAISGHV